MKHRETFEEHDLASAEEALPEGVYEVYPRVPREATPSSGPLSDSSR